MQNEKLSFIDISLHELKTDCSNCFGLCCAALFFSASDGFPADKEAGRPCLYLLSDFRCSIHNELRENGCKGCTSYDCFGAGQKVSKRTFGGNDWRQYPKTSKHMFEAFLVMRQLHEMLWYLKEALTRKETQPIHRELNSALEETARLTDTSTDSLIQIDVTAYREKILPLLMKSSELVRSETVVGQNDLSEHQKKLGRSRDLIGSDLKSADLRGANLRGAYLIAADLRNANLCSADVIGADFRDADIRGADLSTTLFLTQFQINTANGDLATKLPPSLSPPLHWSPIESEASL